MQQRAASGASLGTVTQTPVAPSASAAPAVAPTQSAPASYGAAAAASSSSFSLALPADGSTPEGLPREYEFRFSAAPPAMYVASRGDDANAGPCAAPRHEGRASARCELKPKEMTDEYRAMVKARADRDNAKTRSMGIIGDDSKAHEQSQGKMELNKNKRQKEENDAKRARVENRAVATKVKEKGKVLSSSNLKEAILELFATKRCWERAELSRALGRPDAKKLKECLDKMCDQVKEKGPNYNDYRLNSTYFHASGSSSGGGAGGTV